MVRARVLVILLFCGARTGPQRVISIMSRCLKELGHEVQILSLIYEPSETFETLHNVATVVRSIKVSSILKRLHKLFMHRFRRFQPYLQGVPLNVFIAPIIAFIGYMRFKPDIIVLNGGNALAILLKLLLPKVSIIAYYHGFLESYLSDKPLAKFLRIFEKCTLRRIVCCTVSRHMAEEFEKVSGVKPMVLYPAADVEPLLKLPRQEDGRTLLYVGRIASYRKQHTLVKAMNIIKHYVPEARLVLAGTLKLSDQQYYTYLRKLIERYNLSKQITIRPNVSDRDLLRLYQVSTVYVNPVAETFGLNVVEALAAGLPAIVYKYGGQAEIVRHGIEGFSFPNA